MSTIVSPRNMPPTMGAFSRGMLCGPGRLLFVSGHTGVDEAGKLVAPGDAGGQARRAFENIRLVVEAAGGTVADIVSITTHLTDAKGYPAFCDARRDFFGAHAPTSTTVIVKELVRPGAVVEISAVALIAGL